MSTLAKAVWRGDSGAVHYLSSTPEGSVLIVADPALGVERLYLDGPCRMTAGASYMYLSISATGSTWITPTTTGLLINEYGHCTACMVGPHDYGLWPVCPSERVRQRLNGQRSESTSGLQLAAVPDPGSPPEASTRDALRPVPVAKPEPAPESAVDPAQSVVHGTDPEGPTRNETSSHSSADVDVELERRARALASSVWLTGASARAWLADGLPPAVVDQYLECAVDNGWLVVAQERVSRGSVDPRPVEITDLSELDGDRWGPDLSGL